LGLAGALAVHGILASILFDVNASDPSTFFFAAILLGLVGVAACLLPARRATRVDPMIALRAE
jgi:putative ABC transport system permease protein